MFSVIILSHMLSVLSELSVIILGVVLLRIIRLNAICWCTHAQ
jgi:hypothetical protein